MHKNMIANVAVPRILRIGGGAFIESNLSRISHIQVADNPGRHEPGTGEINYPFLFGFIDRIGYAGWIGCEYKPSKDALSSLGWLKGQT